MTIPAISATGLPMTGSDLQRTQKIVAGAHEFEAMLLEQMLKPLKFGEAESSDGDEAATGASGTVQGFATEAFAKGIAEKGGLGLAKQIVRQVSAEATAKGAGKEGTKGW